VGGCTFVPEIKNKFYITRMKLTVNIKPSTSIKRTKERPRISSTMGIAFSKHWTGCMVDEHFVYALHHEKHRKKVISRKIVNGKTVSKVEPGYWKTSIYKFPVGLLEILNVKIEQKTRNFKIVKL